VTDDNLRSLFFGDYLVPNADVRNYAEVMDYSRVSHVMEEYVRAPLFFLLNAH